MATKTIGLFSKLNLGYNKRLQGDGHENQVEVREDEEQSVKFQEIIDLLVAAGYFRARIKGLSSFDKVVGGMTWCIESCSVEVDVDLLFQENSTIGQKIALTEKIVAVLPKLQCPHHIEPHQIQGLDFIHIFPVIQWLVKRSMEFRSDTSDFVYSYALNEFTKEFPQPEVKPNQLLKHIKAVNEVYKPHRVYRRTCAFPTKDIESKVQITLLEYGHKNNLNQSTESESTKELINTNLDENEIQQILKNMTVSHEETFDYDELTEEDQKKLLNHYKNLNKEIKESGLVTTSEDNELVNMKERRNQLSSNLNKLESQELSVEEEIDKMNEMLNNVRLKQHEVDRAIKELDSDAINREKYREVENLVVQCDKLKKQEIDFRDHCKKELLRLQNLIQDAKKSKSQISEASSKDLDRQLEEQNEKLKVLRLQVAKKNRALSILQRRIDDVPCRAELAQYQRRFIELYNQISAKHKETKQYYSLYNTLEDTRMYMKKELSLLNSVSDSYPEAMRFKEGKDEFLQQFTNILEGVTQSKSKLEKRLSEEKRKRDELSRSLQNLVELNRKYAAAIKQLKVECQKNEELLAKSRS